MGKLTFVSLYVKLTPKVFLEKYNPKSIYNSYLTLFPHLDLLL